MDAPADLDRSRRLRSNDSPWVSVLNLCNAAIGAGVLSFPYGFRQTGVVGGLFFTFVIWVIEVFALCLLVRVAEKYDSESYQRMVHSAWGQNMAVLTSLVMLILTYGGAISYLLISGDVFQPIFAALLGESSTLANRSVVIIIFAFVVILPLAMRRTLKELKHSSVISVVMLTYLTIALVIIGVKKLITEGLPSGILIWEGKHAFIVIDIVVFAFQCHIQVVPIFAELADMPRPLFGRGEGRLKEPLLNDEVMYDNRNRRQRSERLKRMDAVILVSMSICFIGYCLVGEFGYLIFPDVKSDILKSFGNSNLFMNFARVGMAAVAMVCYPLQSHPARSIVDDAWKGIVANASPFSYTRHIVITMFFFLSTLGVALAITDLGTVFSIVGSTGGVMVVFVIPGVLLIRGIYSPPDERTGPQKWIQIIGGILIIAFGLLIFIATSYVTATGLIS